MATYPAGLPVFPVHSKNNEYPKSADRNAPNREIEAICTELGINPKTISPVAPGASPTSVAQYLDMLASAVQTMTGAANWYDADVPMRRIIGWGALGGTVPAGGTRHIGFGTLETNYLNSNIILPFNVTLVKLYVRTTTAQPGTGTLTFTVRVSNVATSLEYVLAAGGAAGIFSATDSVEVAVGERVSVRAQNAASSASAGIAGITVEMDQRGG